MALIVVFVNQSELAPVSNYKVQVLVGDGTAEHSKMLYVGKVEKHRRADGWQALLRQFVEHVEEDD